MCPLGVSPASLLSPLCFGFLLFLALAGFRVDHYCMSSKAATVTQGQWHESGKVNPVSETLELGSQWFAKVPSAVFQLWNSLLISSPHLHASSSHCQGGSIATWREAALRKALFKATWDNKFLYRMGPRAELHIF